MKLKDLQEYGRQRLTGYFSQSELQEMISDKAKQYGVPVSLTADTISTGGLFSNSSADCLKIFHPEHERDYFNYYMTVSASGETTLVVVYIGGQSKQLKKEEFAANTKMFDGAGTRSVVGGAMMGGAFGVGYAVGGAVTGIAKAGIKGIAKGINALTRDKAALAREQEWYNQITEVLADV